MFKLKTPQKVSGKLHQLEGIYVNVNFRLWMN